MKYGKYCSLILLLFLIVAARSAYADKALEIEKEGLAIAKSLCQDDLGCKRIVESYEETSEEDGRYITFTALSVYIIQTLGPKLPQTDENKQKLARVTELFEDRLAIQK